MRKLYKNFFTAEEAATSQQLKANSQTKATDLANTQPFAKIIKTIRRDFDVSPNASSYINIERRESGHKWHKDTGDSDHMMWCRVGGSIILNEGKGGGDTYYGENIEGLNKVKSERGLYDLVLHTSDEWYMVEPNKGGREVLLIFI